MFQEDFQSFTNISMQETLKRSLKMKKNQRIVFIDSSSSKEKEEEEGHEEIFFLCL